MKCGIHGGRSTLVSGFDQGARSWDVADKLSLSAPRLYIPISGGTTYHGILRPKRTGIAVARALVRISGQLV